MNLTPSKKHPLTAQNLDALLQDSYLLVVELRQGASVQDSSGLWQRCEKQVEQVRQSLNEAGVNKRCVELISHAQCALLDETALGCAKDDAHAQWASQPLQTRFFGSHQAGEFLYEDMRESLRQPSPDVLVLTAFQRVLMLGFRGRYHAADDAEREQLLTALNARVAPLELNQALTTQDAGHPINPRYGVRSPLIHILAAGGLLVGVWWGLDHWLGSLIATFVPGQV
ncbi:type IV secretion protein DotU [Pseudomonas agarici]|uniref:Type IV secretion protein DotU n=1 Tax=Pseudomonas agarici TaxID=46677 RepID=A0A0X1T214_PSEAA|nr:type VI secretion system protein TssL, short form [Pseudomonas agarici]AMB86084.1 type IV secretion protein DotU [Pseudomonas agarici]NWB92278.1 DotU family type IV/VI secretion system protein [Pseudomonas agarici]NWC08295.1 DotU family type IV/VI secretion system protein [Pseudomonas agarici]SEL86967.1 type VI secretion system protein ImpK [Pseudomonas agarici]